MRNNIWFLPKKPGMKRMLFHAINHSGLGHLNRSIAVAQWLKVGIPDLQVLFLIEGGENFINPTGLPWIMVPGHNQTSENENCEQITRNILSVFRPDVLMHETVLHEPIHCSAREAGVKEALMANVGGLLRDQLTRPLSRSRMNELDLLIVLQQREEVAREDQALIDQYTGRTLFAGPLVRQKDRFAGDALRKKLNLTEANNVILLTFGGGGYNLTGELLANTLAARAAILERYPRAKLIVITGPYFSGELPEENDFVCYASRFEPFLTDYLNIASGVVCMAGYSTVNEIAASGVPAVCVPAAEADDQVGAGNMEEYIRVGCTDTGDLALQVISALARERDLSVTQEFSRRAKAAAESIVGEIKRLFDDAV